MGAGGCTIGRLEDGRLRVGPESAGAEPGPACYDRGGDEPTVTDADVVLGLIDPDYFLGGRLRLNREKADRAIQRRVAARLGMNSVEAALAIRERIEEEMADRLGRFLTARQHHPEECVLFAFGGAGPLHACRIAEQLGLRRILTFPFGSVFSAFGASTTDLLHRYLRTLPQGAAPEQTVEELRARVLLDMAGEGFGADAVQITRELVDETLIVTATAPIIPWEPPILPRDGGDPAAALKGERDVIWDGSGRKRTQVYARSRLRPGDCLIGPALVEATDTTCAIPPGWRYTVNERGHGLIEREG
jgi:N-methylhydantoinase A/acetophenone carboxylase